MVGSAVPLPNVARRPWGYLLQKGVRLQGPDGACSDGRAKLPCQTFGHIVSLGVIDQGFLFDHVACHGVYATQLVGQSHLNSLLSGPYQATEYFRGFVKA